jgi:uncharacterized membrane protein YadS
MAEALRAKGFQIFKTEDYWAIWLGLGVVALALGFFFAGSSIRAWAVSPGTWADFSALGADLARKWPGFLSVYLGFGLFFAVSMKVMGRKVGEFLGGYTLLFLGSLVISYLAGWKEMARLDLGAPLLALLIGLVIGNLWAMPRWLETALRTEYYIKTGIVLLGATLPLTLIAEAGPIAFLQATIVSVTTWLTIYFAATRLFKLDRRFAAVLGTGGAVCGVSGSIAIGGAVKADKDHIAVGIAVVSIWAIVMIFVLAFLTKAMIPEAGEAPAHWYQITAAEAGAWVGTSEYADAAGFAVVAELAQKHGDAPIQTFTLMKVIGRDIWIGIWALMLSIVSVVFWERRSGAAAGPSGRLGLSVVWERFPKFVIGFFVASVGVSLVAASPPASHKGEVLLDPAQNAAFASFQVPPALAGRLRHDVHRGALTFEGKMSREELDLLVASAPPAQKKVLKTLAQRSDWYAAVLSPQAIAPIKQLRSWAFVLCFLCIGLSTRFKELATFGLKPFWAFAIGVAVNVPLGYVLTTQVFSSFWRAIQ